MVAIFNVAKRAFRRLTGNNTSGTPRLEPATWPNPRESIGRAVDYILDKKGEVSHTCWAAVGPASDEWITLGPQIKSCVSEHDANTPQGLLGGLIVDFYMIGRTKDTATPKVIFRSKDQDSRVRARDAVKKSGIMANYPLIGLGVMPPMSANVRRLADEDVQGTAQLEPYHGAERLVHSLASDAAFGRRFFVQSDSEDPRMFRPTTGGPLLYIGDDVLQLTAGHAFRDSHQDDSAMLLEPPTVANVEIDGLMDLEDHEPNQDPQGTTAASGEINLTGTAETMRRWWRQMEASFFPALQGGQPTTSVLSQGQDVALQGAGISGAMILSPKKEKPRTPLGDLIQVGRLFDLPETEELDYALVKLHGEHRHGINRLPSNKDAIQNWLFVTEEWKIGQHDTAIAAFTSSNGYMRGTLCGTPSYLRPAGTNELQEVFPAHLDGTLTQGDCGGPIIDRVYGRFYGHIVAGTLGTGPTGTALAYILPATKVIKDIETRRGQKVSFSPPGRETRKEHLGFIQGLLPRYERDSPFQSVDFASRKYFAEHPLHFNPQFASKGYFMDLEVLSRILKHRGASHGAASQIISSQPSSSSSASSNVRRGAPRLQDRISNTSKYLATQPPPDGEGSIPSKYLSTVQRAFAALRKPEAKMEDRRSDVSSSFQTGFSSLPLEMQLQILGYLSVPDILNLRLVSRSWNSFISSQESLIASSYLRQPHIPTVVIELFPMPDSSMPNLGYIAGLWYRYSVASKLSDLLSGWITEDLFLRRNQEERDSFREREILLRRRLIPLLLVIFHFFESCRQLLLDPSTSPEEYAALETQIMAQYDDATLLQVHQFFPVLMKYQARRLRPPSYLGSVERSLRGYLTEAPATNIQVAILYLGGLREVFRLTQIPSYEKLRAAVDEWYEDATQQEIRRPFVSQVRKALFQSLVEPATSQQAGEGAAASGPSSSRPLQRSLGKSILVPPTSLAAGWPMAPMTPDEARLVLSKLPSSMNQIWVSTAEAMLLERGVVARTQDIKKNASVLEELVLPTVSWLDVLFYERGLNGSFDFNARVMSLSS